MVRGHTEIPGGECHRCKNRFGNEMTKKLNRTFVTDGYLARMPAGAQTNRGSSSTMCSGFPAKIGEQMIVMS